MDTNVLDTCSPATTFKVRLLEIQQKESTGLSEDRATAIFQVFDEVLPHLAVYQQVLQLVRNELFESVFSKEYTSTSETHSNYDVATNIPADRKVEETKFIQRVPYFTLVQRVFKQRHEEADQLHDDVAVLKKRLHDKTGQYVNAMMVVEKQKTAIQDLEENMVDRHQQIEEKDAEVEQLKEEIEDLKMDADHEQSRFKSQIKALKKRLLELEKENESLAGYKKGYDALEEAFLFKSDEDKFSAGSRRRKPIVANTKSHLLTNFEAAKKLEKQLLMVQNQTIEGFESFLEHHHKELQEKVLREPQPDVIMSYDAEEIMLEQMDTELSTAQEGFQQTVEALTTELDCIRNHKDAIEQQLDEIEKSANDSKPPSQGRRGVSFSSKTKPPAPLSSKGTKISVGGENFENLDVISSEMDPFVPQETILSKYSVMIYTSANSKKTFHELKDAKYCTSCGEKTVLCPHKVSAEKVISLPHNCTHIKLSRPKVRIPLEKKDLLKPHPPGKSRRSGVSDTSKGSSKSRSSVKQLQGVVTTDGRSSPSLVVTNQGTGQSKGTEDNQLTANSFLLLWDDYKQRSTVTRAIPRPLEMNHALSLVCQFYAHVLWLDEHIPDDQVPHSILDELYIFLEDRYLLKDVMFLCMHDFITALIENTSASKEMQIFTHVLVGNLDACTFRYLLVIGDLIDNVDWRHVEDFKAFASNIYSFLNEDEIDQLHLGYTSFSENKISKYLVYQYFMYIVLKFREPWFQDTESKLLQRPVKEMGMMTAKEFAEGMEALAPVTNEELRSLFFAQAEAQHNEEGRVSVVRLSHITSYLMLHQVAPLLRENIGESVEEARLHPSTNMSVSTTAEPSNSDEKENIVTASKLHDLAQNIARRVQNRQMRTVEGNLGYDMEFAGEDDIGQHASYQGFSLEGGHEG